VRAGCWRKKSSFFLQPLLLMENERFLPTVLVKEKTAFFVTAPCSHNTPRSNFIEERQAMRSI
jgi:hypothetical protein